MKSKTLNYLRRRNFEAARARAEPSWATGDQLADEEQSAARAARASGGWKYRLKYLGRIRSLRRPAARWERPRKEPSWVTFRTKLRLRRRRY